MSIELNQEQKKIFDSTMQLILACEKDLHTSVNPEESQECLNQLSNLMPHLGVMPEIMQNATVIFNWAKGQAAASAMDNTVILNAKQDIQKRFLEGQIAKWSGFYERAEQVQKSLALQIEGLRSIISFNKGIVNKL